MSVVRINPPGPNARPCANYRHTRHGLFPAKRPSEARLCGRAVIFSDLPRDDRDTIVSAFGLFAEPLVPTTLLIALVRPLLVHRLERHHSGMPDHNGAAQQSILVVWRIRPPHNSPFHWNTRRANRRSPSAYRLHQLIRSNVAAGFGKLLSSSSSFSRLRMRTRARSL